MKRGLTALLDSKTREEGFNLSRQNADLATILDSKTRGSLK